MPGAHSSALFFPVTNIFKIDQSRRWMRKRVVNLLCDARTVLGYWHFDTYLPISMQNLPRRWSPPALSHLDGCRVQAACSKQDKSGRSFAIFLPFFFFFAAGIILMSAFSARSTIPSTTTTEVFDLSWDLTIHIFEETGMVHGEVAQLLNGLHYQERIASAFAITLLTNNPMRHTSYIAATSYGNLKKESNYIAWPAYDYHNDYDMYSHTRYHVPFQLPELPP
ncbi:hypothetical protein K438DRAFT_1764012 [Mycena galopus ATCC 62051]|nr:hypothetical protein K438DRAFT_1764012 [Mycena galopus ATCC 62051]